MAAYYLKYQIKRRDSSGNIVNGSRVDKIVGTSIQGDIRDGSEVNYVRATQAILTDTIVGVTVVREYDSDSLFGGNYGTPGSIEAAWSDIENVRLVNSFTDGDKTYKASIVRPATGATEEQLKAQAVAAAALASESDNNYNAMSGYFTGSTVDSAWQND